MAPNLIEAIRAVVLHLVAQQYDALADRSAGRLSESELRQAVVDYGRTLIPLPDAAWDVDIVPLATDPNTLSIDVPMWTLEEGRSDLTLSLTATTRGDSYDVVIDDLHVL